jgi:hypothetical protein
MLHGAQGQYQWLESSSHSLQNLLSVCPDLVVGRSLAITSFEERSLIERLEACSGRIMGPVVHVPSVANISALPLSGVKEWYGFVSAISESKLTSFVRNHWFTLGPAAVARVPQENLWDLQRAVRLFWQELQRVQPESYVSRGQRLVLATRNPVHFTAILRAFSAPSSPRTGDLTA